MGVGDTMRPSHFLKSADMDRTYFKIILNGKHFGNVYCDHHGIIHIERLKKIVIRKYPELENEDYLLRPTTQPVITKHYKQPLTISTERRYNMKKDY